MTNEVQNSNDKSQYNLEERTSKFAEDSIEFCKIIPVNDITAPLIRQFVRSSTSIAANYMEADVGETKKDFHHKIGICRKEAKETCLFLRCIAKACPDQAAHARILWKESRELLLIFSAIFKNSS